MLRKVGRHRPVTPPSAVVQRFEIAQAAATDDGVAAGLVAKVRVRPAGIVAPEPLVINELAEYQSNLLVGAQSAGAPSATVRFLVERARTPPKPAHDR
jgi:hypothetical protein